MTTLAIVLGALLAVSEALALIPALKSNSVLGFVINLLKSLEGGANPPAPPAV